MWDPIKFHKNTVVFKIRVGGDLGKNVPMFILQIKKFSEKGTFQTKEPVNARPELDSRTADSSSLFF